MNKKPLSSIILAAGDGTRLRSQVPKALHRICGRPMIVHILRTIEGLIDKKQVVVIGFANEMVVDALRDFQVDFALQEKRQGTGHAVMCCKSLFTECDGDVMVLVGDAPLLTRETVEKLIERHRHQDSSATVLTTKMKVPDGYGRILRHQDNTVMSIVEDKDANIYEKKINEVNTGTYVFDTRDLFDALDKIEPTNEQNEYYLTDVIHIMVKEKKRVEAYVTRVPAETMGINNRVQFAKAERIMRDRILQRLMLSGVTIVDPRSTFIDDSVVIDIDTIIQPNTHIQGRTVIGKGCEIGPLTQIEDCEIGESTRINSSYLRGCTIPPGMSIGPFANLQHGEIVYANAFKSKKIN
ncbi:MAG: UDP-N-acetylglucosamine diphosphorylase/glucosamine-1-phosphate N-acetyltransferase [Candidatus Omnitrophota bacterium]|nr:MAG: UDP-N-acetylglucosamine diphosphorylase/glucosamine-1-phosphate N-acetyltransferase [Candidatus Omnitrophota bacterium]